MRCDDVFASLETDSACRVFNGKKSGQESDEPTYLGYECGRGKVVGPS